MPSMAHVTDTVYYQQWVQLLEWMREWADAKGLRFDKESDFTQYIFTNGWWLEGLENLFPRVRSLVKLEV